MTWNEDFYRNGFSKVIAMWSKIVPGPVLLFFFSIVVEFMQ